MSFPVLSRRRFLTVGLALPAAAACAGVIAPSALAGPAVDVSSRVPQRSTLPHSKRHAVFVSVLPEHFEPVDEADQPIDFEGPVWVVDAGLTLKAATRVAQRHNREAMALGLPRREWAFVLSYCRAESRRARKGGA